MGAYLFNIKREDARRAVEALYLEEGTDTHLVLEELRMLRFDLDEYISELEAEIARGNGNGSRIVAGDEALELAPAVLPTPGGDPRQGG